MLSSQQRHLAWLSTCFLLNVKPSQAFSYLETGDHQRKWGKFPGICVALTELTTAPSRSVCQNYLLCYWTTLQGYLLLQRVWLQNVYEVLQKKHFIIAPKYLRQFYILSKADRVQHVISASSCRISPNLEVIFFLYTYMYVQSGYLKGFFPKLASSKSLAKCNYQQVNVLCEMIWLFQDNRCNLMNKVQKLRRLSWYRNNIPRLYWIQESALELSALRTGMTISQTRNQV